MKRILAVCTGNICRSPLAAGYLNKRFAELNFAAEASSAGTFGVEDYPASPQAREVAIEQGFNIDDHRGRRVTAQMLDQADLVLAMEPEQLEQLRALAPQAVTRLHLLTEYCPEFGLERIPDPYGTMIATYRHVFSLMKPCLEKAIERIMNDEL